jgi:hypothetical protein
MTQKRAKRNGEFQPSYALCASFSPTAQALKTNLTKTRAIDDPLLTQPGHNALVNARRPRSSSGLSIAV